MMQVRGGPIGPRVAGTFLAIVCSAAGVVLAEPCPDVDSDAYADCLVPGCDASGVICGDCDDADASVHPGAPEPCNGKDDNCDGQSDETSALLTSIRKIYDVGAENSTRFGTSLAVAGDLTGDGVGDFVVGHLYDHINGKWGVGSAVVVSGSDLSVVCRMSDPERQAYAEFGHAVEVIGDVTGDGVPDVAVGAPMYELPYDLLAGAVFIFSGADCAFVRKVVPVPGNGYGGFGSSIASLPDVTMDGVPDLVVGEPRHNTAQTNNVGSLIILSGSDGSVVRRLTAGDGQAGERLGASVATIPDLDDDGFPDIVAGAPFHDGDAGEDRGRVLVFSTNQGLLLAILTDPEGLEDETLGTSVAGPGDLNGDGVPEVIAGAPGYNGGNSADGAIVVFSLADGSVVRKIRPGIRGGELGSSITALDDRDGDAVPDFAAGAPRAYIGGAPGMVVLFSGASGSVLRTITDPDPDSFGSSYFGGALVALDDLDGDGRDELAIGAKQDDGDEGPNIGSVSVISLSPDCDGDGWTLFNGDCDNLNEEQHPGNQERCDGLDNDCNTLVDEDADGDGYAVCDDCIDHHPWIHPGADERCNQVDDDCDGQVDEGVDLDGDGNFTPCDCNDADENVNRGATEFCNARDDDCDGRIDEGFSRVQVTREVVPEYGESYQEFGRSIAGIGDVNGDGRSDFIVGVPAYNGRKGHAFVYSGADLTLLCDLDDSDGITASPNYDGFGYGVAGIGDVTGDHVPDIAVGSRSLNTVTIFSGENCQFVRELSDATEPFAGGLGSSIAGIGDVDGDDVPDLAAGAPATGGGMVVVFSGEDGRVLFKSVDPAGEYVDRLGQIVSAVGDVTADGVPDFAAGAPNDANLHGRDAGSVLVFSGADGSLVRKILDPSGDSYDYFGRALTGIGDVTGDGVPDIAVGSPAAGRSSYGSAYGAVLVFSGKTGAFFRRIIDPSAPSRAYFGYAVAPTGDINGDGKPELIVGEPGDVSTSAASRPSTILIVNVVGGVVMHALEDPSGGFQGGLGMAVAGLPDITGDGFPEILGGAPAAVTEGPRTTGKVLMFTLESDCDGDGYGPLGADCDDGDVARSPGLAEVCNAIDDDCDGLVDEDGDGDGFAACEDCDVRHRLVYPGAPERCNGIDDDCDGQIDQGDDVDGDGYTTACDCDDADLETNPGAVENCNHVDDNCDSVVDEFALHRNDSLMFLDPDGGERNEFGEAVAGIGDVTGDGIPDFAVGSFKDREPYSESGSVLVFSGADRSLVCKAIDDHPDYTSNLGKSVLGLGDVTGDGVPDFAAGAYRADHMSNDRGGKVMIFSGADCSIISVTQDHEVSTDYLGFSLSPMGDINGDGVADLLAGGGAKARVILGNGTLHVFLDDQGNPAHFLDDPLARIPGYPDDSVARIDDLTGDGVADILLGIPRDSRWNDEAGVVVLFSGSDGRLVRRFHDPLPQEEGHFGRAVASISDLSGDGIPDILVGAPGHLEAGAVVALSGADGSMIRRYMETRPGDCGLGFTVLPLEDLTGDGVPEILAGMADNEYTGLTCQEAVVVFDGANGEIVNRFEGPIGSSYNGFGRSIALAGDMSGHGVSEYLVGAPLYDHGLDYRQGAAFVVGSDSDCDEDGFTPYGGDCADSNPDINPAKFDFCGDGLDDDCIPGDGTGESWYGLPCDGADRDQCEDGALVCEQDVETCDDDRAGSVEVCSDADDDCNGEVDDVQCDDYDVDGDGRIYGSELATLGRAFGSCSDNPEGEWWAAVDYNGDGCIEGEDLVVLANLWGLPCFGEVIPCP